jgi:hypothetical protein
MKRMYGTFFNESPKVTLSENRIPEKFWPLLPYAEFWGISDDWTRESLVRKASADVRRNLKEVVAVFDNALMEWLAESEADSREPSDEYVAFSAMVMAADFV